MASPPPAEKKLPPTTVKSLDPDALREILVRLPSLPSLVRAALTCRSFLEAVRSPPSFRRRFLALHPPPLLGFFLNVLDTALPTFVPLLRRSDPDVAAAIRGADFFLTRLPPPASSSSDDSVPEEEEEDEEEEEEEEEEEDEVFVPECSIDDCRDGFLVLDNWGTQQIAVYNPLARTMDLFPMPPSTEEDCRLSSVGYHIQHDRLSSSSSSFRIICVQHGERQSRAFILSSDTGKWQVFPWADADGIWPPTDKQLLNGCIYLDQWVDGRVLNTATMQFSQMDKPPRSSGEAERLTAGHTKDGSLCVVYDPLTISSHSALAVWIRRSNDHGFEGWMLAKSIPLQEIAGIVHRGCKEADADCYVHVRAIIDGYVYLSAYGGTWQHYPSTHWLLSLCVETAELSNLGRVPFGPSYPYVMPWPHSLVATQ